MTSSSEWFGIDEFAQRVGISPRTVRRGIAAKQITYKRTSNRGRFQFNQSMVDAYNAATTVRATRPTLTER